MPPWRRLFRTIQPIETTRESRRPTARDSPMSSARGGDRVDGTKAADRKEASGTGVLGNHRRAPSKRRTRRLLEPARLRARENASWNPPTADAPWAEIGPRARGGPVSGRHGEPHPPFTHPRRGWPSAAGTGVAGCRQAGGPDRGGLPGGDLMPNPGRPAGWSPGARPDDRGRPRPVLPGKPPKEPPTDTGHVSPTERYRKGGAASTTSRRTGLPPTKRRFAYPAIVRPVPQASNCE